MDVEHQVFKVRIDASLGVNSCLLVREKVIELHDAD